MRVECANDVRHVVLLLLLLRQLRRSNADAEHRLADATACRPLRAAAPECMRRLIAASVASAVRRIVFPVIGLGTADI
jgi:hypothetical protein